MVPRYAIGVDFGTLSARALVVDVTNARELSAYSCDYAHAVMDKALPDGTPLPGDWALQHPKDYIDSMATAIEGALAASGIDGKDVIGLGIDFTACTMLPVVDDTPLCMLPGWEGNKHAYVKLWKHHAAQDQANRLNELAEQRGEAWLKRYGGKISSEWMFPKLLQTLEEAPEVYEKSRFMEAADWVVLWLTGQERRNACTAGYKAIWSKREGYPSQDFLAALHPGLRHVVDEKLSTDILPQGAKAGMMCAEAAARLGLSEAVAVCVANVDAHVSLPAVGITQPGVMLMIMGTSTCHILLGDEMQTVPGMCGVVEDGVLPGFFGYEAGQSCVGDHFSWVVKQMTPQAYYDEAKARGLSVHEVLTEACARLQPGESGLLALDWWNGNRSVLVDADLTGLLIGATLQTTAPEIYRALIEATAFGTRMIIETFEASGVPIKALAACGGIAKKNAFLMQTYADITGREICIGRSNEAPALGSAMFGAVAAGKANGGYDDIVEAAQALGGVETRVYRPNPQAKAVYDELYTQYAELHDAFGKKSFKTMKLLKGLKRRYS